ncbi:ras GTPase-activating protein 1-like [Diadema setosum]|uniref:ras GTPase-activating protein 1-like n=1 Tax=Diadema setosum TaxID=31175 RepID=UPI003B3A2A02
MSEAVVERSRGERMSIQNTSTRTAQQALLGRDRLLGTSADMQNSEEFQDLPVHDDFDPFESYTELPEETVDANLTAPPENEWYQGCLDRHTAEMRLHEAEKPGSYLVRESERKPGSYVLSYLGQKGINHFRITAVCGDFYVGGRQFQTLSELIGYYTHISNILKNERLQYPVPPPEPVDDKKKVIATLPYNKVPDTDELSFSAGEVFVVHNELGGGWLWVTSQRTGESGIIVQDLVKPVEGDIDPNEGKVWFHGNVSKEDAAETLWKEGNVGSFLIRNSDKNPGDYSLSFRGPNTIQRFRIQKQQRQYVMGGRYYNSLDAIVDHYKREEIIDGYKLLDPTAPKKFKNQTTSTEDTSPVNYEELRRRRSSGVGMHIMTGMADSIIKQGHLSKKSQKHKKWKTYYFVLNSTEQHLYYFDNEARVKPRGLIDLGYASVYTVHESLFARPNCFQIVVRALNDLQVFYLNAESQELEKEWVQVLRSCCSKAGWTTQSQRSNRKRRVKQLKSLRLRILEAHKIPGKLIPHAYCIVSLNEVKVARTPVQQAPNPVWDEEFLFDDFPDEIDSFTIDICNGAKRAKPIPVCRTTVLLDRLTNGSVSDEWYPLISAANQSRSSEMGSIRARAQFISETLMPIEEYSPLKELIFEDADYQTIFALEEACAKDRAHLASVLLDIFMHQRKEISLLKNLNSREIEKEAERTTLFRSNTLATTLMDRYMKTTAQKFVQRAVGAVILKIMESKQSCELNPQKFEKGADATENLEHLLGFLKDIIESIFSSTSACPRALRYLCACIQTDVKTKWKEDPVLPARAVGGFIFLRLICPAILNPRLFNIVSEAPSPVASRTLMMVAKAIQNLANQVEFSKEPYMEAINPFIVINKGRMIHFLTDICVINGPPTPGDVPPIDLARQLAALHQLCVTHLKELQQLSTVQPSLKILLGVTEMLNQRRIYYVGQQTTNTGMGTMS